MGLQLGALGDELDARAVGQGGGDRIVTLDPHLIESAFISDRLTWEKDEAGQGGNETTTGDDSFADLVASIRDGGQQVPVLVRPHAEHKDRYQAAYGHRRIAACRVAGVTVKAIVRPLTDGELVLAQGRENALRRDLSFIEKARFAAQLIEAGFARADVQRALVLHAADMTRMLTVAAAVPSWAAQAIGPAPKAGRARWNRLAQALETAPARSAARKLIATDSFAAETSDARFARMLSTITKGKERKVATLSDTWTDKAGRAVATLSGTAARPVLTLKTGAGASQKLLDALRRVVEERCPDQPKTGDGVR